MSEKIQRPALCLTCGRTLGNFKILVWYCSLPCAGLVRQTSKHRMCANNGHGQPKRPFPSEQSARNAADSTASVYECKVCGPGLWHIGHEKEEK